MRIIPPLELPAIPVWYDDPPELAQALYNAIDQQAAVERALAAVSRPDPSFAMFKRQIVLEIALAVAKLGSSSAICELGDWLDEVDP